MGCQHTRTQNTHTGDSIGRVLFLQQWLVILESAFLPPFFLFWAFFYPSFAFFFFFFIFGRRDVRSFRGRYAPRSYYCCIASCLDGDVFRGARLILRACGVLPPAGAQNSSSNWRPGVVSPPRCNFFSCFPQKTCRGFGRGLEISYTRVLSFFREYNDQGQDQDTQSMVAGNELI